MFLSRAFTLIELLVTMAIVATLATCALPAYDRYVVRAEISKIFARIGHYQLALVENITTGEANRIEFAVHDPVIAKVTAYTHDENPVKYIIDVETKMQTKNQKGIGIRQPKNAKKPLLLQFQGINVDVETVWTCNVAPAYNDYMPNNCRHNDLIE